MLTRRYVIAVETTAFLRDLRAVRRFDPRPVPGEVLADVLETARWTGSAKNAQPWHLVVVQDRGSLEALSRLGRFAGHVAGAPLAIALVMGERSRSRSFDEGRLAERIMLAAWAHGVGACVATLFPEENEERAVELLGAPAGSGLRTVVSLGYPKDAAARRLSSQPGSACSSRAGLNRWASSRVGAVRPSGSVSDASAVPDVLAPGLEIVFCGINPGRRSSAAGAHFANPRNDFWRLCTMPA